MRFKFIAQRAFLRILALMVAGTIAPMVLGCSGRECSKPNESPEDDPLVRLKNAESGEDVVIYEVARLNRPEDICVIVEEAASAHWPQMDAAADAAKRYGLRCVPGLIACLASKNSVVRDVAVHCLEEVLRGVKRPNLGDRPDEWLEWWLREGYSIVRGEER